SRTPRAAARSSARRGCPRRSAPEIRRSRGPGPISCRSSRRQRRGRSRGSLRTMRRPRAPAARAAARGTASRSGQSGPSVAFERGFALGVERLVSAPEVPRLHADRLRLRLHLDRRVETDVPFLVQHLLRHGMREGRPGGELRRNLERRRQRRIGNAVEKAPGEAFFGAHRAAGVEQLGGASLADHARQHRAGTPEYNALDFLFALETKEEIPQLGIRLESQRILALRAVQGNDADLAFDAPEEMLGLDHEVTSTACCFTLARSLSSSSCSRRERPASSFTTHSSCARAISPKLRSPARVSRMRKARRSAGSSSRSTSPSFSSWSTMAVTLPPVTISRRESSFILSPSRWRSSCAIRSKRGSVVAKRSRRRERTRCSIKWVQVSSRSQMRSALWSSEREMVSRSVRRTGSMNAPSLNRSSLKHFPAGR